MIMTNWHKLKPGLELDRLIAERLGWTEIEETEVFVEDFEYAGWVARLRGRNPEGVCECYVPRFSTDLNAAWSLFTELLDTLTPRLVRMFRDNKASIIQNEPYVEEIVSEYGATPELAIDYAWLAYDEVKR